MYRAINFTADTLANMPFAIVNESGDEQDISEEYKNVVGFLPYPRAVLRLWVQSLLVTNRAYGFQEKKGSKITNLRYIAPATIAAKADADGLQGFTRQIGTVKKDYFIDGKGFCNIFYIFNLNWKNELLPDDNSPFKAMCNAAGIGYWADTYIRNFFERGGIKPTILTFDGVMDQTSMERVEGVWTKIVTGYYRFLGKVFNGKFTPTVIGDGIDHLKDSTVYDNALRNIAIALGMPQDALLQNADSYATAQVHKSTWFSDTLTPLARMIEEPLNEQIFKFLGLRWEFRPEMAIPHTEEVQAQLTAAKTLYEILTGGNRVDADKAAIEAMGIDLPQWFKWEEKEPEPVVLGQGQMFAKPGDPPPPMMEREEKPAKSAEPPAPALSLAALRELNNWQELAFRKLKRGQPLAFEWEPKDISPDLAAQVKAKLDTATTEDEIKAAFDVTARDTVSRDISRAVIPYHADDEIKALADAMNELAKAAQVEPVVIKQIKQMQRSEFMDMFARRAFVKGATNGSGTGHQTND